MEACLIVAQKFPIDLLHVPA